MKVLRTQRSIEPCIEGGFYGYYIYFDAPVSTEFVEGLKNLGALNFMQNLKKPFFLLRGERFILRGQVGDDFCKAGIRGNDKELLTKLCRDLEPDT